MLQVVAALPHHLPLCAALASSLEIGVGRDLADGFLLPSCQEETALREALVLVALDGEELAGFVRAFDDHSSLAAELRRLESQVVWDEEVLSHPCIIHIDKLAVAPLFRRRGVARRLYAALAEQRPGARLLAAVVEAPQRNAPSESFHLRSGFKRVGTFRAARYGGLDGYSSGIYCKDP